MLTRTVAALALLFLAPLAIAETPPEPAPPGGLAYFVIDPPQPSSTKKVEVIEVFSYGCIHCANFQPLVDKWRKNMPAEASFSYMPALFRPDFALLGRAFYTAEALGVAEKSHADLFKAIFVDHRNIRSLDDLAQFYSAYGIKPDDFIKTASSFAVENKVSYADNMVKAFKIDGTPSIIVAGKYRISGASAGGYDKVFDVVNTLVAKEAAARRGAKS